MYRMEQTLTQSNVGKGNSQNKAYRVRTKRGLFVLTRQIADPVCSISINLNHRIFPKRALTTAADSLPDWTGLYCSTLHL